MQHMHLNSSYSSLSNSSNMSAKCDRTHHGDKMSNCSSLDFSLSEKNSLAFFLAFLGFAILSCAANGVLFFLTVRYKKLLWQPQYVLINNMSACGFGLSFVTFSVVSSSVVRKQTQMYDHWCIAQFSILRCFFLTSQMTLALMSIERYIFICHGIHYLRMIDNRNVHISMGLAWLCSVALSFQGGSVLSRIQCGFGQQTSGLLCDAITLKAHFAFTREEDVLMFGPPVVIGTFCISSICYCYGCMYRAALRVSIALKCKNHRANRTVGFYFFMFLLQLAMNITFAILTMIGKRKAFRCTVIGSIVTPLVIIIPAFINAAFLLARNPQVKRLLFAECRSPIGTEAEVFQLSRGADGTGEHACRVEAKRHVEREDKETTPFPLPGCAVPSVSEDC